MGKGDFHNCSRTCLSTFIPSRARKFLYDRHNTHGTLITSFIKTKRMKRIILLAFLASSALMSQASIERKSDPLFKQAVTESKAVVNFTEKTASVKSTIKLNVPENCTVTMKGSLNGGVFSIEVSCTATASTCDQAASKATSCLSTAIRRARQAIS